MKKKRMKRRMKRTIEGKRKMKRTMENERGMKRR
jgi:hypothetical protein